MNKPCALRLGDPPERPASTTLFCSPSIVKRSQISSTSFTFPGIVQSGLCSYRATKPYSQRYSTMERKILVDFFHANSSRTKTKLQLEQKEKTLEIFNDVFDIVQYNTIFRKSVWVNPVEFQFSTTIPLINLERVISRKIRKYAAVRWSAVDRSVG